MFASSQLNRVYMPTSSSSSRIPVVLKGAAGHASVVLDALQSQGVYEAVSLLDRSKPAGTPCGGLRVEGSRASLPALRERYPGLQVIVTIGENWARSRIVAEIRQLCPGIQFATVIHPSAQIGRDVVIGEGSVILAGAVVNPGARIGKGAILNTRASIDHDSVMGDFASLGPAAAVGGGSHLGSFSHVGIGACVIQGITIGEHTVVGAGAVVVRNIPELVVAYGTPARIVRPRQPGDRYLSDSPSYMVVAE
jgi:sugar O-acyltransferase (sialic acid O-acetyltransferase NeuD family)